MLIYLGLKRMAICQPVNLYNDLNFMKNEYFS